MLYPVILVRDTIDTQGFFSHGHIIDYSSVAYHTLAEITDAAMGHRPEYVMLNKVTHLLEAVKTLSGLLSAEERH